MFNYIFGWRSEIYAETIFYILLALHWKLLVFSNGFSNQFLCVMFNGLQCGYSSCEFILLKYD
jgi:hypothetical protein